MKDKTLKKNNIDTVAIRRIDELGRVVIPKNVRTNLQLGFGNEVGFSLCENGKCYITKYEKVEEFQNIIFPFLQFFQTEDNIIFLVDNSKILFCSNCKYKNFFNKNISDNLKKILNKRQVINLMSYDKIELSLNLDKVKYDEFNYVFQLIFPIIIKGDLAGGVIVYSNKKDISFYQPLIKILEYVLEK